ncbi:MAG: LamG domain-containing protein [Anaerolineae bacterium]|nr:LamG domain-containing protein [Anaerolineae bacterium]
MAYGPVITLTVDDQPPTAASGYSNTRLSATPLPNRTLAWAVTLSGTISDPPVGAVAGSGVATDTVTVELIHIKSGELLGSTAQTAVVSGGTWSIDYITSGKRPSGAYSVRVAAADAVGNALAPTVIGTVRLDARPPSSDLYVRPRGDGNNGVGGFGRTTATTYPDTWLSGYLTQSVTLYGTTSEFPVWGGALARFSFEESSPPFYNGSALTEGQHLTCATCPSSVNGTFGKRLYLPSGDVLTVITDTAEIDALQTLSIAFWWMQDSPLPFGTATLVALDGKGVVQLAPDRAQFSLTIDGVPQTITVPNPVPEGQWTHIAATYDGVTMRLYENGVEVAALAVSGAVAAGTGLQVGDLAYGADGFFDELVIHDRALTAQEVEALADPTPVGIGAVELWLEKAPLGGLPDPEAWTSATVTTGGGVAMWEYTLPTDLEGYYLIHVRSSDLNGNMGNPVTPWHDVIDMVAPRIQFEAVSIGLGAATQTQYTFTIDDFVLDPATVTHPCHPTETAQYVYDLPGQALDGAVYRITGTCRIYDPSQGQDSPSGTVAACDAVGHCGSDTQDPIFGESANVAIATPMRFETLPLTTTIPITGGVFGYLEPVNTLTVTANAALIAVLDIGGVYLDTWSADWSPTATGPYTLTAVAQLAGGTLLTDTIQVTLTPLPGCADVAVVAGWNMVSLPVLPADATVATLFPNATSPAYAYQNGYVEVSVLELGQSYWLKFDAAETVSVCGQSAPVSNSIAVSAGWNMIGIYDSSVAVGDITASAAITIESSFYGYTGGYVVATDLEPGQGYWVKVSADGTLSWPAALAAPVSRSGGMAPEQGGVCTPDWSAEITVTDTGGGLQRLQIGVAPGTTPAYDPGCDTLAPPPPPGGAFDARLQTTTEDVLADYQGTPGTWIVAFDAGTGADPISLAWDPSALPNNADGYYIQDRLGGILLRVNMAEANSVTVTLPLSDLEIVYEGPTAVTLASVQAAGFDAPDAALVWQVTALAALLGVTLLLMWRRRERLVR